MTERQRLKAARHEAGHVLVILALNGKFEDVEIGIQPHPDAVGSLTSSDRTTSGFVSHWVVKGVPAFVIVLMAGTAGERINRKKVGSFDFIAHLGAASDRRQAEEVANPDFIARVAPGCTFDKYLNQCLAVAHGIIARHKDVHDALVDRLMQHGRMTYSQANRIWKQRRS